MLSHTVFVHKFIFQLFLSLNHSSSHFATRYHSILRFFFATEHRQWIVMGYDGKDEKALERRMAARPSHMSRAKQMKKNVCTAEKRGGKTEKKMKRV